MDFQLLSANDAAEIAGCHHDTIRRAVETCFLNAQRVGKTWVIVRADLDKWIEDGKPNRRRDSASHKRVNDDNNSTEE